MLFAGAQPRPQGTFPSKAGEKRPGDEVAPRFQDEFVYDLIAVASHFQSSYWTFDCWQELLKYQSYGMPESGVPEQAFV